MLLDGTELGRVRILVPGEHMALNSAAALLAQASAAPDLARFIREMGWLHPYYAQLRRQVTDGRLDPARRGRAAR